MLCAPQDMNNAGCSGPAEVVGQCYLGISYLSTISLTCQLKVQLMNLGGACCSDGMTLRFETAASVHRDGSGET